MGHQLQDMMGESSRGAQDADIIGAIQRVAPGISHAHAKALSRLVARGVTKQSSQIGFIAVAPTTAFIAGTQPITAQGTAISAVTRVQRPFKPCKFFVQEFITVTDSTSGTAKFLAGSSATALDVFLSGSFMGGDNTFPNAPTNTIANGGTAVNCAIFNANNLGSGISWAEVPGGIDMTLNFILAPSLVGLVTGQAAFSSTVSPYAWTWSVSAQILGPMSPT